MQQIPKRRINIYLPFFGTKIAYFWKKETVYENKNHATPTRSVFRNFPN